MTDDGKKDTRRDRAAEKARASAKKAARVAFKAYQRWCVANCVAKDTHIDAGNEATFADWVKDEIK